MRRFLSIGVLDQAMSSLSTLAVSISILNGGSITQISTFAIVIVAFGICVSLSRSLTSEPSAVLDTITNQNAPLQYLFANLKIALPITLLVPGIMLLFVRDFQVQWLVMALAAMAVVFADVVRSTALASARAGLAAIGSSVLLIGSVFGLAGAIWADDIMWSVSGWGLAGLTAFAIGCFLHRNNQISRRKPVSFSFFGEFLVTTGASQAALLASIAIVGQSLAVSHRTFATVFGPYHTLYQALALLGVPILLKLAASSGGHGGAALRRALVYFAALSTVLALYGIAVFLLQGPIETVFPQAWATSASAIGFYVASLFAGALLAPVFVTARSTRDLRVSRNVRLVSGAFALLLPVLGATLFGLSGYFIAVALSSLCAAIIGMLILRGFYSNLET